MKRAAEMLFGLLIMHGAGIRSPATRMPKRWLV